MRTSSSPLFILLFLFFAPSVFSQGLFGEALSAPVGTGAPGAELNGFIRSTTYIGREMESNDIYYQSLYSQLGLQPSFKLGSFGRAYADIRFRYGHEFDKSVSELDMNEIYGSIAIGPLMLDAGKKAHSWGAASFINPTNQFAATDPVFRSPEAGDQQIGIWSLSGTISLNSSSSMKFLYLPVHTPSKLMTSAFAFPDYLEMNTYDPGRITLKDGSFGLYYDLRSSWLDMQLSYFQGYRNLPGLQMDTVIFNPATFEVEELILREQPYKIYCPGINLAVPFASYIFRIESAWLMIDEDETNAPFSELSYAAEIEQSGNNVTLIGGYYGKYIFDHEKKEGSTDILGGDFSELMTQIPPAQAPTPELLNNLILNQIQYFNTLYNYQEEEFYHSVYASLSFNLLFEQLKFELPAIYNITVNELAFMPSLKIAISDGLFVQLGSYFLYGKEDTLFDFIAPGLNAGYATLKFEF